jgi:DNA-binding FadR family transcriptional regulator
MASTQYRGDNSCRRKYLHIADMLRQAIGAMDVDPSGRLPAERELAQILGVSRPTLREALIVLELRHEIEIRMGSGIYLTPGAPPARDGAPAAPDTPDDSRDAVLQKLGDSPRDVNQMRVFLEGGVAAHAARFISAAQLKLLKKSLADMRAAVVKKNRLSVKAIADADRLFHTTLAASTDNGLLVQTLEYLFDQRYTPVADAMHQHYEDPRSWEYAVEEHQDIYDAIAARDPLQAQAAMQRHLSRAHTRLMPLIG